MTAPARDFRGALHRLIIREARCKAAASCPRLTIRELFFEPNPFTIEKWQREHGCYRQGLDRRVVFICESPSDRRHRDDPADFKVRGVKGWQCWNTTPQDARFRSARERYGFQDCLVTNAVKCGVPRPSTPANLTDEEANRCAGFLADELRLLQPSVVACLGNSALQIALEHVLPALTFTPLPVLITHYSFRGSASELEQRWRKDFARLRRALTARGTLENRMLLLS